MSDETWPGISELNEYEIEAVTINEHELEQEMRRVPADFAYLNQRLVEAAKARDVAERELKAVEARVYVAARQNLEARREKYSERMLDSIVRLSQDVKTQAAVTIAAEEEYRRAKSLCDAVRLKADMLTSIGMRVNAELRANPLAAAQHR